MANCEVFEQLAAAAVPCHACGYEMFDFPNRALPTVCLSCGAKLNKEKTFYERKPDEELRPVS